MYKRSLCGSGFIFAAVLFIFFSLLDGHTAAQDNKPITRQEMLRGSITPERAWWDVLHYDLSVQFLPETRTVKGSNLITFKTLTAGNKMQIDLQEPLAITLILHKGASVKF